MTDIPQRAPRPWFRVEAKAAVSDEPTTAEVYIYDEIGESWWGGVSPKALVDEIAALDVDTMTVHLNSPGGAAWDGITIMNALRAHRARIEIVVDGLAASAASVIAMAGDSVTMNRGAQMMIHDASGMAWGNAETMEETAGVLHKLSDSYADVYAARAGGDRATWRAAMRAETWYTAEEAVKAGLADRWDGSAEDAEASASFDLSRFRYQGRAHAPAPLLMAAAPKPPDSTEPGTPNRKDEAMAYGDLQAGLRERLGVTDADATDDELLAAVDEALAEQADTNSIGSVVLDVTSNLPDGALVVDKAVHEQLLADAAAGREAKNALDAQRRDSIITAALGDGRIAPASRDSWRAQLDKDEDGTKALLESLPKNTIPVTEIGRSDEVEADSTAYPAHWKR
ncbi:head maturation protease, ClpP-related [Salana multivorans]